MARLLKSNRLQLRDFAAERWLGVTVAARHRLPRIPV